MRVFLSFAFFITACATQQHAGAAAAEASPIAFCLQEAARAVEAADDGIDDGIAARACIGTHAAQCMEHGPNAVTTIGMMQCYEQERAQWAVLRAAAIEQLTPQAAPDPLLQAMLTNHERWAQSRCDYAAAYHQGGSMARVVAAACANRLDAELTLDLLTLARIEREP